MHERIKNSVSDAISAAQSLLMPDSVEFIERCSHLLAETFKREKKALIAGNGGSLCDAMHFCEELTGYFRGKRRALPAIALSDPGHMTCVANDTSFDYIFARSIEALGNEDDVLIILSTSGNSENIVKAVQTAHQKKMKIVGFLGKDGGRIKGACDLEWIVSDLIHSDRIQEAHMTAIHIIIEIIEQLLFQTAESEELLHNRA
jgi:D-sedoheptulose 7-phosphate isomerase